MTQKESAKGYVAAQRKSNFHLLKIGFYPVKLMFLIVNLIVIDLQIKEIKVKEKYELSHPLIIISFSFKSFEF